MRGVISDKDGDDETSAADVAGCSSWHEPCWCRTLSRYCATRHRPARLVHHCHARGRSPSRIDACN